MNDSDNKKYNSVSEILYYMILLFIHLNQITWIKVPLLISVK